MIQGNTRKGVPFLCIAPLQRDVIKIIAFLAMVADHVATATGVGSPWLNLVGRCAFLLFALVCGCNLMGKTPRQSTLNRLWLMALLAQPAFWLAFRGAGNQWWQLNILFCFALVLQLWRFVQNPGAVKGFLSGVLLTLVVICGVHAIVPAAEQRLWVSRWFAEGYTIQLLLITLAVASLRT